MKVWITKYALTQGIYEAEVEPSGTSPSMVVHKQVGTYDTYYHGEGKDWHRTEVAARAKANKMVQKKIDSLKMQLAKLEGMEF